MRFEAFNYRLRISGLYVLENEMQRAAATPEATVLPGDNRSRILETLPCESFGESPGNDCIDEFIACARRLPDAEIERLDKARAHAYLAARPRPRVSVGVAAQKRLLAVRS